MICIYSGFLNENRGWSPVEQFSLNHLSDTQFEEFCYDLLSELGFTNINRRKGTGLSTSPSDRGRDIEYQTITKEVDGKTHIERWFVECKHYQQGVSPDKIQGALAWAMVERPACLLIIVSNFLSNPTKDFLESYINHNKPSFRIKWWEKPDLEKLTSKKASFLRKHSVVSSTLTPIQFDQKLFLRACEELERALYTALVAMDGIPLQQKRQTVHRLWSAFSQLGSMPPAYAEIINKAIDMRNATAHIIEPTNH